MRILVVEDEINIQQLLKMNLEMEGYEVVCTSDGSEALKLNDEQHFDLVILDLMLPQMSGMEVCHQIRLKNLSLPILMLTAKGTPGDRIKGLKAGADDYLAKPFHLEELLLRVKNLLKRSNTSIRKEFTNYQLGESLIDFSTYTADTPKGKINLTKKEAMLLKLLIERKNQVVSRQQILQTVWGYDIYPSTRTIDNFILSFRKYFEQNPKSPEHFLSVRGVGYKYVETAN